MASEKELVPLAEVARLIRHIRIRHIQPHRRFAELRDLFRQHPEWLAPWVGTVFRFQTVDFPAPKDVLRVVDGEKLERLGVRRRA